MLVCAWRARVWQGPMIGSKIVISILNTMMDINSTISCLHPLEGGSMLNPGRERLRRPLWRHNHQVPRRVPRSIDWQTWYGAHRSW